MAKPQENPVTVSHQGDQHFGTIATKQEPQFPEGGSQAWLVVVGSAFAMFSTFGVTQYADCCPGVYQEYYINHQLKSYTPSSISWIGSLQVFFLFSSGIIAGPLFDRYGEKLIYLPCITYILAVMMTSLCAKYYQFVLAQGILSGFSVGLIFTPAMSVPNHYFRRKIGTALGIVVAGSSVGGVIFPITLNRLLNSSSIGFAWTVRICGFMIATSLCVTYITVKARLWHTSQTPSSESFKRPLYYLTVVAVFFMTWGIFVPYFYLASFSTQRGMSVDVASYLLAILNAASFFGRIIPGVVADRFGRYNVMCLAAVCSSVLLLCWQLMTSNAAILTFTALYGFFSGATISLVNACVAQITPSPRQIGAHVGMLMFVTSFAGLSGPPISGALVARYGNYGQSGIFAGVSVLVGAAILFGARFGAERNLRKPF